MRRWWIAAVLASTAAAQDAKLQRGKYLVDEVAKCQECHTPKMDNGDYIKSQSMKGTTLGYTPVSGTSAWKSKVPDVTANSVIMKRWGDEGMIRFLETGKNPRGNKAGSPMPAYNLTHDDAEAVTVYLKSIQ